MQMEFFFFLSLAVLVLTAFAAVWMVRSRVKNRVLTPLNVMLAGVLVATVLLYLPMYFARYAGDRFALVEAVLLSLYSAVRMFAVDSDYDVIVEQLGGSIAPYYMALTTVFMILAPVLTVGVAVSFFGNLAAYIRLFFNRRRAVCVFTRLTSESLTLARDMKKNDSRRCIVFCAVEQEEDGELYTEARELDAICFSKDVLNVRFGVHSKKRPLWFFAIAPDENENTTCALRLCKAYGAVPQTRLYVFAHDTESEVLLTSVHPKEMKVRRVDTVRSLIYSILYDGGNDLFENAIPQPDGDKLIHAVVIGMGRMGSNMVRSLAWYCQLDGYRLRIDAFDKDPDAKDIFEGSCPELMSPSYNGVIVPGESQYTITIHPGMDVRTKSFADEILKLSTATYVLIALGTDEENIAAALQARMLFERCGAKPVIQAVVWDSEKKEPLAGLKNFKGQAYNVDFIGDLESNYVEKVIVDSKVEADALSRHLRGGYPEAEFWAHEYNYRSSIALAIHAKLRSDRDFPGARKFTEDMTEEEKAILEPMEHRRWNAYMRSEGYVHSAKRNDLAKMHHNLVNFDDLSEEDKRKDSIVGG